MAACCDIRLRMALDLLVSMPRALVAFPAFAPLFVARPARFPPPGRAGLFRLMMQTLEAKTPTQSPTAARRVTGVR